MELKRIFNKKTIAIGIAILIVPGAIPITIAYAVLKVWKKRREDESIPSSES